MATSVKMNGIENLNKKLAGLKYEAQKRGGRAALRKAAQFVRNAARSNASALDDPGTSDVIAKNIVERWSNVYNKRTGNLMFRVGILGGVFGKLQGDTTGVYGDKFTKATRKRGAHGSFPGGDTRHWGYLEFGTERAAARPFFQRALSENAQAATDVFIRSWSESIDRALAKAGK